MNKGRLAPLLEEIPIFLVRNQFIGVKGALVNIYLLFNSFLFLFLIKYYRKMREENWRILKVKSLKRKIKSR